MRAWRSQVDYLVALRCVIAVTGVRLSPAIADGHFCKGQAKGKSMRIQSCLARLVIASLAAGWGVSFAQTPKSANQAEPISCYSTAQPIRIDGQLNEPAWAKAYPIPLRFDLKGQPVSPPSAFAKFLWNATHLYVAMVADDRDLRSTLKGRDFRLWTEDVLELFIKPSESSQVYYEFEFSPAQQVFDAYWPKRGYPLDKGAGWNSQLRVQVHVRGSLNNPLDEDQGWQVEIALPLSDLSHAGTGTPRPGDSWRVAACRYDYDRRLTHPQNTATFPVSSKGGFHEYERYNRLLFAK